MHATITQYPLHVQSFLLSPQAFLQPSVDPLQSCNCSSTQSLVSNLPSSPGILKVSLCCPSLHTEYSTEPWWIPSVTPPPHQSEDFYRYPAPTPSPAPAPHSRSLYLLPKVRLAVLSILIPAQQPPSGPINYGMFFGIKKSSLDSWHVV